MVTVIATQALTRDECWTDLARGDVLSLRDGAVRLLQAGQAGAVQVVACAERVHARPHRMR